MDMMVESFMISFLRQDNKWGRDLVLYIYDHENRFSIRLYFSFFSLLQNFLS
jgi:hypothetical protein